MISARFSILMMMSLILELKGDFPSIHEKIEYRNYVFEIFGIEGRRISKVKVTLKDK